MLGSVNRRLGTLLIKAISLRTKPLNDMEINGLINKDEIRTPLILSFSKSRNINIKEHKK
jgi:hypothetical protein